MALASCSNDTDAPTTVDASDLVSIAPTGPSSTSATARTDSPAPTPTTTSLHGSSTTSQPSAPPTPAATVVGETAGAGSRYPLRIGEGSRSVLDSTGEPFLIVGDAAWSLIVELDRAEVDTYLANRSALGFNAVLVELIEHRFSSNPPFNRDGDAPFLTPGDFSTPNEAYFAHADWVLQRLADEGFVVFLTPAYTGWIGGADGWWEEMVAAGPDVLRDYGRFVGDRYGHFDNIVWVAGGDGDPTQPELVAAIAEGIRERDPDALQTAHLAPDTPPREFWAGADWLDIDNVYTYESVYDSSRAAYEGSAKPFILMESSYENEHGVDTRRLRTQVFHALLTGATGHIFGNNPIWHFGGGGLFDAPVTWTEALDGPGSTSMAAITAIMGQVAWSDLRPDLDGELLVGGVDDGHDRAVAAIAGDRSWAMVYVPTDRTVTLDLASLDGANRLVWLDPTTGAAMWETDVDPTGPIGIESPGDNAGGDTDWVVLVERA